MKTFPFIQDPSHAWLRVPRTELVKAGCAQDISSHSYQKGRNVYLEKDCDAQTFVDARTKQGLTTNFAGYTNKARQSRIRGYESYTFTDEDS